MPLPDNLVVLLYSPYPDGFRYLIFGYKQWVWFSRLFPWMWNCLVSKQDLLGSWMQPRYMAGTPLSVPSCCKKAGFLNFFSIILSVRIIDPYWLTKTSKICSATCCSSGTSMLHLPSLCCDSSAFLSQRREMVFWQPPALILSHLVIWLPSAYLANSKLFLISKSLWQKRNPGGYMRKKEDPTIKVYIF